MCRLSSRRKGPGELRIDTVLLDAGQKLRICVCALDADRGDAHRLDKDLRTAVGAGQGEMHRRGDGQGDKHRPGDAFRTNGATPGMAKLYPI